MQVPLRWITFTHPRHGGVAEWSKAAVLKTAGRKLRGFESYRLRHSPPGDDEVDRLTVGEVTERPMVLAC